MVVHVMFIVLRAGRFNKWSCMILLCIQHKMIRALLNLVSAARCKKHNVTIFAELFFRFIIVIVRNAKYDAIIHKLFRV